MDQLLYRAEDAAAVLGLGRSKVFELMASGALQSVQIGRARRIPKAVLEAYVERLSAEQFQDSPAA